MSSRNQYLAPDERARAPRIHQTLLQMRAQLQAGESIAQIEHEARAALQAEGFQVDYIELRRGSDLARPAPGERDGLVALAAARLGTTRLIDNLELDGAI
jgi:pantoate--beta-alanine ligase